MYLSPLVQIFREIDVPMFLHFRKLGIIWNG